MRTCLENHEHYTTSFQADQFDQLADYTESLAWADNVSTHLLNNSTHSTRDVSQLCYQDMELYLTACVLDPISYLTPGSKLSPGECVSTLSEGHA